MQRQSPVCQAPSSCALLLQGKGVHAIALCCCRVKASMKALAQSRGRWDLKDVAGGAVAAADVEAIAAQGGLEVAEVARALEATPLAEFSPDALSTDDAGWEAIAQQTCVAEGDNSDADDALGGAAAAAAGEDVEMRVIVHELLDALPEKQARVLSLAYGLRGEEKLRGGDIAARCGLNSRQAVAYHLRRATAAFKQRLEERRSAGSTALTLSWPSVLDL
jgi:hypothetical protein